LSAPAGVLLPAAISAAVGANEARGLADASSSAAAGVKRKQDSATNVDRAPKKAKTAAKDDHAGGTCAQRA